MNVKMGEVIAKCIVGRNVGLGFKNRRTTCLIVQYHLFSPLGGLRSVSDFHKLQILLFILNPDD